MTPSRLVGLPPTGSPAGGTSEATTLPGTSAAQHADLPRWRATGRACAARRRSGGRGNPLCSRSARPPGGCTSSRSPPARCRPPASAAGPGCSAQGATQARRPRAGRRRWAARPTAPARTAAPATGIGRCRFLRCERPPAGRTRRHSPRAPPLLCRQSRTTASAPAIRSCERAHVESVDHRRALPAIRSARVSGHRPGGWSGPQRASARAPA